MNAEPVEEPKFAVGDRVRHKFLHEGEVATIKGLGLDGMSVNIAFDGAPHTIYMANLQNIASLEPIPEKTWGVDPNGSYVKGVTRFEVKAGMNFRVEWPENATAVYCAHDRCCGALSVRAECATRLNTEILSTSGQRWSVPCSALRLIEPLATPKPQPTNMDTKEQLRARLNEAWKGYESRCSYEHPDAFSTPFNVGSGTARAIEFCFTNPKDRNDFSTRYATELSELYRRDELPESHSK